MSETDRYLRADCWPGGDLLNTMQIADFGVDPKGRNWFVATDRKNLPRGIDRPELAAKVTASLLNAAIDGMWVVLADGESKAIFFDEDEAGRWAEEKQRNQPDALWCVSKTPLEP